MMTQPMSLMILQVVICDHRILKSGQLTGLFTGITQILVYAPKSDPNDPIK